MEAAITISTRAGDTEGRDVPAGRKDTRETNLASRESAGVLTRKHEGGIVTKLRRLIKGRNFVINRPFRIYATLQQCRFRLYCRYQFHAILSGNVALSLLLRFNDKLHFNE